MDIHYHPIGTPQIDEATQLVLMLADEKPAMISRTILLGNFESTRVLPVGDGELLRQPQEDVAEFLIPKNAKDHIEEMTWTWKLPIAIRTFGAGTHMHYVGRGMRVTLERANPTADHPEQECLIETPEWDFNWQRGYGYAADYAQYPTMAAGDRLRLRCVFDNTMENRFLAQALQDLGMDEPVDVRLGEDTLDEMCLAGLGIIYPNSN